MATASILTIGSELVSGDVPNTNGSWIAKRLAPLGVSVRTIASLPDELTREALAHAFDVPQEEVFELAVDLRARFTGSPDYAARWARLPRGSRPLPNPLGGAPGFVLENVYVLPGLPAEMEAMYETVEEELPGGPRIASWRHSYRTTESTIAPALVECGERWPGVLVGSYPSFGANGPYVEVVLKSNDPDALEAAAAWFTQALEQSLR